MFTCIIGVRDLDLLFNQKGNAPACARYLKYITYVEVDRTLARGVCMVVVYIPVQPDTAHVHGGYEKIISSLFIQVCTTLRFACAWSPAIPRLHKIFCFVILSKQQCHVLFINPKLQSALMASRRYIPLQKC